MYRIVRDSAGTRLSSSQRKPFPWLASGAALALLMAGCAQLPDGQDKARFMEPSPQIFEEATSTARMDWPQDQWWQRYGSEQLNGLMDIALQNAPDMAAAAARLRQAQALLGVSASVARPQLSANALITADKPSDHYALPAAMASRGMSDQGRATLDWNWSLDLWGQHRAAMAAAVGEFQAREADAAQARLVLTSSVAAAYADLVHLSMTERTLAQSLQLRKATARLFAERFANGLENRGGVHSANARAATAQAQWSQTQEQMALQRHRLAALTGAGPDRSADLMVTQRALDSPWQQQWGLPENLHASLLGRRPDVVAARLQAQSLESRVAAKQAQFYPDVNLVMMVGVQSIGLDFLLKPGSGIASVGSAISLPIFNGGRLRAELGTARAQYDEAVALYHRTLNHALQEVASNAVSQRALQQQLAATQQAVDAAVEAQRVARDRYAGGLANYLEVLAAEDQLLGNVRQLVKVRARALSLDIDLHRALGGGWQAAHAVAQGPTAELLN